MKRCPECRRDYYDDTLAYCLEDGTALVQGSVAPALELSDGPATAMLHGTATPENALTRAQIGMTEKTAVFPSGINGESRASFDKRLLFAPLVLIVIVLGGFITYRNLTSSKQFESIAVMPFINEGGNAEVEYLSDGMTETLINSLSQIPKLNVKARSSVFRYKGRDVDPKILGHELGVQAILTGRVTERGDQLTLSLELIDAVTENTIWGNKYERRKSDLVALQNEAARDVSAKLKFQLSGTEAAKLEKNYTSNSDAYQLYLKGKFSWNKRTADDLKRSVQFFQQAIEKDPNYALAYSGLADTYVLFSSYDVASADDSMPLAKAASLRALSIEDSLAEAHTALGFYYSNFEWDRGQSETEYRKAIQLKPDYATGHHWYGADIVNLKRFDESLAELRRAQEIDPLSPIIGTNLADVLVYSGRVDDGIAQYKRVIALDPQFASAHVSLGTAYGVKKMYPEAIAEARKAIEIRNAWSDMGHLGLLLARSGDAAGAKKLLETLKQEAARNYVPGDSIALIYLGLGEKTEALNWLEKHMLTHAETASAYGVNPELEELRSEPRFKDMLKRMNLPE
jgi:TolB-like protein/Tfp pilus assembly protein PilF